MSYTIQHNTQQKSLGLFVVFAFHIILIFGLLNGLNVHLFPSPAKEPLQITTIPDVKIPEQPVIPITTDFGKPNNKEQITAPTLPVISIKSDTDTGDDSGISGGKTEVVLPQITKPTLVKASKPEYPTASIRLNEEGATTMVLFLNEVGRVVNARVVESSGSTRLDDAAIKHAQHNWTFSPCTSGDKPVACSYQTKLIWRLADVKR